MLRLVGTFLFCIAMYFSEAATAIHIQQPFTDTLWCAGGTTVGIKYNVTTSFASGNVFMVQLSDASGNFSSGSVIGFISATVSGTIICYPSGMPSGNAYRIRVISTMPADTSQDNGVNIHIGVTPPLPNVNNNSPQCLGGHVTLSLTNLWPNTRYLWSGPGLSSNSQLQQLDFNNVKFSDMGSYVITAEDTTTPSRCLNLITTNVIVKPLPEKPTASILTPVPACEGDSVELFANSISIGPEFEWTGPNGFTAIQPPKVLLNPVSAAQAGWYVAYGNLQGCRSVEGDSVWLEVKAQPHPVLSSNGPVCAGQDLHIGAHDTGSVSYSWKGPGGFISALPDVSISNAKTEQSGYYIMTATRQGCSAKDSIFAQVNPLPFKPIIHAASPLCAGDTMYVSWVYLEPTPGGQHFKWTGPGGFSFDSLGIFIPNVQESGSGNYVLTVIANTSSCSISDTVPVVVKPTPFVKAQSNKPYEKEQLKLSADCTIPGASFIWSGQNGFSSSDRNPVINNVMPEASGLYTVKASYDGCNSTDTVNVVVYERAKYTLFDMYPNPNNGSFTLHGHLKKAQTVYFEVCYLNGAVIYTDAVTSIGKDVEKKITLPGQLSNGVYLLRIHADNEMNSLKFSIVR